MSEVERFVEYYGDKEGKYEVGEYSFKTKRRAKQFASIFYRRIEIVFRYEFSCCVGRDSVYVMPSQKLVVSDMVPYSTDKMEWVSEMTDYTYDFFRDKGDKECKDVVYTDAEICRLDLTTMSITETKR